MSHEIRTPLAALTGLIDLLGHTIQDPGDREVLRLADQAAEHLMVVVQDVLDFSAIEAGDVRLAPMEFTPAHLLRDAAGLFAARAAVKGVVIRVDGPASLDVPVLADAGRIHQVVHNLVANAVRLTDSGEVVVAGHVHGDPPERLVVTVSDTGPGVPEDEVPGLFEPFRRGAGGAPGAGTGLGLSIARTLVRAMGGDMTYRPRPGGGAEFTFDLAVAPVAPVAPVGPDGADAAPSRPEVHADRLPSGLRVLIAEDNPVNRGVLRRQLELLGCDVEEVEDGRAVVAAVAAGEPGRHDLILMDCRMPVLDGFGATAAIRRLPGGRGGVPIVALTANAFADDRRACLAAGMDGYLAKPVRTSTLLGEIAHAIGHRFGNGEPGAVAREGRLDRDHLAFLVRDLGGDRREVERLTAVWEDNLPPRLAAIRAARAGGDGIALANAAHALQSPSIALGCLGLGLATRDLEALVRDGAPDDEIDAALARVLGESEATRHALAAWRTG